VVQSSTIDPVSSDEFFTAVTGKGARYLEAPFTGSKPAAEQKQVVYYVGGDAQTVAALDGLLGLVSLVRLHIGDHQQATTLKLAMNLNIAAQMEAEDWTAAATTAQKLYDLEPLATGADSGLWLRAKALHRLEKHEDERLLLEEVADKAADAVIVFQRLLELEQGRQNLRGVQKAAGRLYALNPFLPQTTQSLAMAEEELGNVPLAAQHNERLLLLKPPNPAVIHHKLATLYRSTDAKLAKRHLLDALAMAPRWPEALALLLEFPE
jgi:tetratricopeptide (TPR) repeat protein